jgi:hypothetical protein
MRPPIRLYLYPHTQQASTVVHLASDSRQVSGLDQLHRKPRFLAGGGKALIHGGE